MYVAKNGKPFEILPQTMTQPPWLRKGSMNHIDINGEETISEFLWS